MIETEGVDKLQFETKRGEKIGNFAEVQSCSFGTIVATFSSPNFLDITINGKVLVTICWGLAASCKLCECARKEMPSLCSLLSGDHHEKNVIAIYVSTIPDLMYNYSSLFDCDIYTTGSRSRKNDVGARTSPLSKTEGLECVIPRSLKLANTCHRFWRRRLQSCQREHLKQLYFLRLAIYHIYLHSLLLPMSKHRT